MRFDRTSPGEGVKVSCRLENGKACLEWSFAYTETDVEKGGILHLFVRDRQGKTVLECIRAPEEEEPMRSILLQPHLWNGVTDPYLYSLEALLTDRKGNCVDRLSRQLALYYLDFRDGLFLNGRQYDERAVKYSFPQADSPAEMQRIVTEDLQRLRELGANCIYIEKREGLHRPFLQLCERVGFLVRPVCESSGSGISMCSEYGESGPDSSMSGEPDRMMCPERKGGNSDIPVYRGGGHSLVSREGELKSEFYRYKAMWGDEPFVYIVPESVHRQENGSFSVAVYSNCGRVALYSNGILHEFQSGSVEFLFREISAKGPYVMLAAEAEGCAEALSLHRTFTKLSRFDDI